MLQKEQYGPLPWDGRIGCLWDLKKEASASAILLSLVQTCRNCNVNPQEYLEDVMKKLLCHNSQRLHELLPHEWTNSLS